MHIIIYLCVW